MSLTRFDLPALPPELIEYTLTFLTEQEVLWFAQTSKVNTQIAHHALLNRGMSHWPWRKLLVAATMQPDLMPLSDTLVLQRTHQPRDNIFDEAARALFLLAKTNRQVVISDQWIKWLLSVYLDVVYYKRFAAGNILSVLIPIMTDTQFVKMFDLMLDKEIKLPNLLASSLSSSLYNHTINLLQLMVLRLNSQQLIDCSQEKNVFDMMDIVVGAEHAARIFNNMLHPYLASGYIPDLHYFYGFGKRPEMFLKLHQHLNPEWKQVAVKDVRRSLGCYNNHVAKSAYRLMQSMAPDALNEEVQAGVEKLKRHLETRNRGEDIGEGWQQVLGEFGAMAPSLTALHLEVILPPMVHLFTAWSGTTQGKESFEEYGLKLFGEVASCMSDPQVAMALSVVEQVLNRLLLPTQNQALFALAQLLKRVNVEKRTPHISQMLHMYLLDLADTECVLDVIMTLAQDMSEAEAESIFPKLQRQLLNPPHRHNDRDLADVAKDVFTALIPRLSKDTLLKWIATWKDNPWLFLRCLYLRTQDLDNDVLIDLIPQVIGWLGNRPGDVGFALAMSNMAQTILVSFTSRPNVTLPANLLSLIHGVLVANPYRAAPYNVWCHLMTVGKYDLRPLNASLPRGHASLDQLILLIEAASSDEPTATPLVSQAPQPSSVSVVSSGLSFFTIIPQQPQPSVPAPSIATPQ